MTERLVTYPTWRQDTVETSDDAYHTIATIPVPTDTTVGVRIVVVARATNNNEGLFAEGRGGWRDIASVATPLGNDVTIYQNAYDWDVRFNQSGGNILIEVNGDTGVNVAWICRWTVDSVKEV